MTSGVYKRKPFTPEHRDAISRSGKGRIVSDETRAKISAGTVGIPKSSDHCAAISAGKKGVSHTSEAQLLADEMERGGNDIVWHHYIYDHSNLSKNIVGMARSDHTRLHELLKKLGYVTPHINVE